MRHYFLDTISQDDDAAAIQAARCCLSFRHRDDGHTACAMPAYKVTSCLDCRDGRDAGRAAAPLAAHARCYFFRADGDAWLAMLLADYYDSYFVHKLALSPFSRAYRCAPSHIAATGRHRPRRHDALMHAYRSPSLGRHGRLAGRGIGHKCRATRRHLRRTFVSSARMPAFMASDAR